MSDFEPTSSGARAVWLIGYRGSGKSSVAARLAGRRGCPYHDLDREIEVRAGRSIAEIFRDDGEPAFRDLEHAVLVEVAARIAGGESAVVATGGGAILRADNVERMRECGTTVWLRADPSVLAERIASDAATVASRPALGGVSATSEVAEILARRLPLYDAAADIVIETTGSSLDEVVDSVLSALARAGFPPPAGAVG